jgi:mono/diheme cytochrome c family protein
MPKKLAALIALVFLALFSLPAIAQENKTPPQKPAEPEFKIPPEEVKRENPVKPSASSIAEGKHTYTTQCVMCHGANGDGKGELATDMKLTLKDYRDPAALKSMTDGEMFYILNKGKGEMPGQEGRFKPEQLWNLINYIRSLAGNKPEAK